MSSFKILLIKPRGFCAGVSRAVDIVKKVLIIEKEVIYVKHVIVHNEFIFNELKNSGVFFIKELYEVPNCSVCIFSAHGVSKNSQEISIKKSLTVYDATCPLVTKVHKEINSICKKIKNVFL